MNNQETIENQLGIYVIDSGIGNPDQVRDINIEKGNIRNIVWLFSSMLLVASDCN